MLRKDKSLSNKLSFLTIKSTSMQPKFEGVNSGLSDMKVSIGAALTLLILAFFEENCVSRA